ncbi:hypothetical protein C7999DRAFT_36734, partial [Corynascus novoguineensis]
MANTPASTMPTGTLGPTESTVMAIVQQVLAAQAGKRQLPLIEKIKDQEDFPAWRDRLLCILERHGLDKYVLTDVPRPESPAELKQWLDDRADVDAYLQAVVGDTKVWTALRGMGWKARDIDPKKTFDKLTQYFEGGLDDIPVNLMMEFATTRRDKFASMEAFQSRINYLKDRLQTDKSPYNLPDIGYIWFALKGIAHEYPDLYNRCVADIKNGTLTWGNLMEEFQRISVTEKTNPALTTVQINKKDDKTTTTGNTNAGNRKTPYRGTCGICKKTLFQKQKHCKGCDSHISKGVDECWWCDPEKAPDTWHNKEVARLKKAERQRSTTAPLHQQSGVANASTSKPPMENPTKPSNPKSVLFTTSLLGLPTDMP